MKVFLLIIWQKLIQHRVEEQRGYQRYSMEGLQVKRPCSIFPRTEKKYTAGYSQQHLCNRPNYQFTVFTFFFFMSFSVSWQHKTRTEFDKSNYMKQSNGVIQIQCFLMVQPDPGIKWSLSNGTDELTEYCCISQELEQILSHAEHPPSGRGCTVITD